MASLAYALCLLTAAWLAGLGVWMAIFPHRALAALAAMGGSPAVHFGEMTLRVIAGAALVGAAAASRAPGALLLIGAFLIASALVLMALPRRWHAAYSTWWAARIPAIAVRIIAPFSVIAGLLLAWCLGLPGQS